MQKFIDKYYKGKNDYLCVQEKIEEEVATFSKEESIAMDELENEWGYLHNIIIDDTLRRFGKMHYNDYLDIWDMYKETQWDNLDDQIVCHNETLMKIDILIQKITEKQKWEKILPKAKDINYVIFKLSFRGGYALKIIKDEYFININGKMSIEVSDNEINTLIEYLKENGYKCHEHSILKWSRL